MRAAMSVRLVAMLVFLAGCSTSDPVYLRHPQTGEKVQCGPYMNSVIAGTQSAVLRERDCIRNYQDQGYEEVLE